MATGLELGNSHGHCPSSGHWKETVFNAKQDHCPKPPVGGLHLTAVAWNPTSTAVSGNHLYWGNSPKSLGLGGNSSLRLHLGLGKILDLPGSQGAECRWFLGEWMTLALELGLSVWKGSRMWITSKPDWFARFCTSVVISSIDLELMFPGCAVRLRYGRIAQGLAC
jgi:hypothetical protein